MMRRLWAILCITAIALVSVRPARTIPADVQDVNTSGYLTSILKTAENISDGESPVITIETDTSSILIKGSGDMSLAIISQS